MIINVRYMYHVAAIFSITASTVFAMQNPVGTLDTQTRQRFAKIAPELHNIDLFWSKLSQDDQLILKEKRSLPGETGRVALSDEQFKYQAAAMYLNVMPYPYRAYYYAQSTASYAKRLAANTRYRISSYFSPKLEPVGKVAVEAPKTPPIRVTKTEKIPILSQLKYKHKVKPLMAKSEAVAVPESQEASPFEPPTPRQFIATIESQNIPQNLHSQVTIPCTTSDKQLVYIPRNIVYLFPTLNDVINTIGQKNVELTLIDSDTLKRILTVAWRLRELLTHMTYFTKKTYDISKTYAPDDIPLTIRHIVAPVFKGISISQRINLINAANFMQAKWLLNALAAEYVSYYFQPPQEEKTAIAQDVQEDYLERYRVYFTYQIHSEYSIADVAFLRKRDAQPPARLTKDWQAEHYHLDTIQEMEGPFRFYPEPRRSKVLLTSLTGFEFLDIHEIEKIQGWDVWIPSMHQVQYTALRKYIVGIPILKPYTFLGCTNLKHINLATTGIKKVAPQAFAGLTKIELIMLNNTGGDETLQKHFFNLVNEISSEDCARIKKEVGDKVQVLCPSSLKAAE